MLKTFRINSPESLNIADEQGISHFGASQYWYREPRKRTAGCGPTTFANIFHYLTHQKPGYQSLIEYDTTHKEGFIQLMDHVWSKKPPGPFGIYQAKGFRDRALLYGKGKGVSLQGKILEIPFLPKLRPTKHELSEFMIKAIRNDTPVAFLNRSNGKLRNLSSWHWVTIIGYSQKNMQAEILDNGEHVKVDMGLWLRTTLLGGGLVSLALLFTP